MPTFVTPGHVRIKSPFLNTENNVRHLLFGLFALLDTYVCDNDDWNDVST